MNSRAPIEVPAPAGAERAMQRVGRFTGLPALIRQLGVDPGPLLIEAGLPAGALDDPEGRASYATLGRIMLLAAERTATAHFGLLAGRMWHLPDLGLLGELARHSPTVGLALQTLTVHQHLNSEGGLAFTIERAGLVDFGYAIYHLDQRFMEKDEDQNQAALEEEVRAQLKQQKLEMKLRTYFTSDLFKAHSVDKKI